MDMWWLIVGDLMAQLWICGGSFVDMSHMWWLIVGDLMAHLWICGGSFVDMWWLICGYVLDIL